MSKLLESIESREQCRAHVLELRRSVANKRVLLRTLQVEISELAGMERRELARLTELTTEVAKLAHADLAGIVGRPEGVEGNPASDADMLAAPTNTLLSA